MENSAIKTKLVTFWIVATAAQSASAIVLFMAPGVMDDIIAGTLLGMEITEGTMLAGALLYWLIPLTMALLSLMLKGSLNRWINIIVGIILAVIEILAFGEGLMYGQLTGALMSTFRFVVLALVVWHAWKWPKQET